MKKNMSLELMRIIACMLVIINHCNSQLMFYLPGKSRAWYVTVFVFYMTKVAVPIFLMISGYTMLHREDDLKKNGKRILRIAVVLLLFSLIYYLFHGFMGLRQLSVFGFFATIWHGPVTDAFWYLYLYLGILIMFPFLQKMAAKMERKDYHLFFLIALVFCSILPTIGVFVPEILPSGELKLPLICCSISYLLLGDYFYRYGKDLMEKADTVLLRIGVPVFLYAAGMILNLILTTVEWNRTGGATYLTVGEIEYIPLLLESLAVFFLLLQAKIPERIHPLLAGLGGCTFGVYLLADLLVTVTQPVYYYGCIYVNRLIAVALQQTSALLLGFTIIFLLRKIPGMKKLI